ncbi:MAG: hypothetical protein AAGG68_14580 [Bacteroidota bacterium]
MDISSYGFNEYFSLADLTYDAGMIYGVRDNLDLGAEFSILDQCRFTAFSKYQFVGDRESRYASSFGLELGTMLPLFQLGYETSFVQTSLLYYNSFYAAEKFSISLSPRYTFAYGIGKIDYNQYESIFELEKRNHFLGYHFALTFGKYDQISFELSQFWHDRNFAQSCNLQLGIGVLFR